MKHIKRAALLLLALATALAFSGCKAKGKSVQAYFDAAQKRIERVDLSLIHI